MNRNKIKLKHLLIHNNNNFNNYNNRLTTM